METSLKLSVASFQYDFGIEERVIQWTAAQHHAAQAHNEQQTENIGDAIEQFSRHDQNCSLDSNGSHENPMDSASKDSIVQNGITDIPNGGLSSDEERGAPVASHQKPSSVFLSMNMLVPTPIAPSATDIRKNAMPEKSDFNVADFESESDPFDNLELQTLNEMEELNKVLGGTQVQRPCTGTSSLSNSVTPGVRSSVFTQSAANSIAVGTILKDVQYPDVDSIPSANQYSSHPLVSKSNSLHCNIISQANAFPTSQSHFADTSSVPPMPEPAYLVQQSMFPKNDLSQPSVAVNYQRESVSFSKLSTNHETSCAVPSTMTGAQACVYSSANATSSQASSKPTSAITVGCGLRSARSTPDIPQLLESSKKAVTKATSHTPPPYLHRVVSPPPGLSPQQVTFFYFLPTRGGIV